MKILYKGKEVAEMDRIGAYFMKTFIFPSKKANYRWHTIQFIYKNFKEGSVELEPKRIEETVCDFTYLDDFGIKEHLKVNRKPISVLKTLTKNRDLWEPYTVKNKV